MGRVQTAGEATSGPLSPSRRPLRAHFHRERETSGYETVPVTSGEATGLHDAPSQRDNEHILERQNHKVILEKADLPSMADILIQLNLTWLGHVERMDFARLPSQLLYF